MFVWPAPSTRKVYLRRKVPSPPSQPWRLYQEDYLVESDTGTSAATRCGQHWALCWFAAAKLDISRCSWLVQLGRILYSTASNTDKLRSERKKEMTCVKSTSVSGSSGCNAVDLNGSLTVKINSAVFLFGAAKLDILAAAVCFNWEWILLHSTWHPTNCAARKPGQLLVERNRHLPQEGCRKPMLGVWLRASLFCTFLQTLPELVTPVSVDVKHHVYYYTAPAQAPT